MGLAQQACTSLRFALAEALRGVAFFRAGNGALRRSSGRLNAGAERLGPLGIPQVEPCWGLEFQPLGGWVDVPAVKYWTHCGHSIVLLYIPISIHHQLQLSMDPWWSFCFSTFEDNENRQRLKQRRDLASAPLNITQNLEPQWSKQPLPLKISRTWLILFPSIWNKLHIQSWGCFFLSKERKQGFDCAFKVKSIDISRTTQWGISKWRSYPSAASIFCTRDS